MPIPTPAPNVALAMNFESQCVDLNNLLLAYCLAIILQTFAMASDAIEPLVLEPGQTLTIRGELSNDDPRLDDAARPFDVLNLVVPSGSIRITLYSQDFDAILGVFNGPNGVWDRDSGGWQNARLEFVLEKDEALALVLSTHSPGGRGAYDLSIHVSKANEFHKVLSLPQLIEVWPLERRLNALENTMVRRESFDAAEEALKLALRVEAIYESHLGTGAWRSREAQSRVNSIRQIQSLAVEERIEVQRAYALSWEVMKAHAQGDARRAIESAENVVDSYCSVLGDDHPYSLSSMNNLAAIYRAVGDYANAELLYVKALEGSRRIFGDEHPETLTTINNLAVLYLDTGSYVQAEPLLAEALEGRRRVLGEEHPDTLTSINNLGGLCESTGRYAEAEALYVEALKISRRVLGNDHLNTLLLINNLAIRYQATALYAQAEHLYIEALVGYRHVLGDHHPSTLLSINNLGYLYSATGRYTEAEVLYREALNGYRSVLGDEHPDTLILINNLAVLYQNTGRYMQAEPLFVEALEICRRVLGYEHPQTLLSLNNLGNLYVAMRRYAEAVPLYIESMESHRNVLGNNHPNTLGSINNLALLYQDTGRYAEATPLCLEALEGRRRVLGNDHPETLQSMHNLGYLYLSTGRYAQADAMYIESLEGSRRVLGNEHPDTLTSINNLAFLYQDTGRLSESLSFHEQALRGRFDLLRAQLPRLSGSERDALFDDLTHNALSLLPLAIEVDAPEAGLLASLSRRGVLLEAMRAEHAALLTLAESSGEVSQRMLQLQDLRSSRAALYTAS
ncbi:MAG: tetratricopeptide repeat protein, partial [Phycisphaeraceae bacterium]